MAELTLFSYRHGDSVLHLLDARIKLGALAAISMATLRAGPHGLGVAFLMAMLVLWKSGTAPQRMIGELRFFILFLAIVWLTRAMLSPGEVYVQYAFLSVSKAGIYSGAMLSGRLLVIALLSLGVTATTPSAKVRAAVEWYLRPIPGVPHQTIATMIGLLVRFIPVIFAQSREIAEAQRARGVDNRNPFHRMLRFGMPLLRRSFITADRLACAMEARNYSSQRSRPALQLNARDYCATAAVAAASILMVVI